MSLFSVFYELRTMMRVMVEVGIVAKVEENEPNQKLEIADAEDRVESGVAHMQPYGLSAWPPVESRGVSFAINGRSTDRVILAASPDDRPSVEEDEVKFYSKHSQIVHFNADKGIVTSCEGDITTEHQGTLMHKCDGTYQVESGDAMELKTSAKFKIDASDDVTIIAGGKVKLHSAAANRQVARNLDPVQPGPGMLAWMAAVDTAITAGAVPTAPLPPTLPFASQAQQDFALIKEGCPDVLVPS